jgi:hypothetical protein
MTSLQHPTERHPVNPVNPDDYRSHRVFNDLRSIWTSIKKRFETIVKKKPRGAHDWIGVVIVIAQMMALIFLIASYSYWVRNSSYYLHESVRFPHFDRSIIRIQLWSAVAVSPAIASSKPRPKYLACYEKAPLILSANSCSDLSLNAVFPARLFSRNFNF